MYNHFTSTLKIFAKVFKFYSNNIIFLFNIIIYNNIIIHNIIIIFNILFQIISIKIIFKTTR